MTSNDLKKIFRKNLLEQLEERKIPQSELAHYLGVSTTAVNNWTRGLAMPRMDKIDDICRFFSIDRATLLSSGEEKHVEQNLCDRVPDAIQKRFQIHEYSQAEIDEIALFMDFLIDRR